MRVERITQVVSTSFSGRFLDHWVTSLDKITSQGSSCSKRSTHISTLCALKTRQFYSSVSLSANSEKQFGSAPIFCQLSRNCQCAFSDVCLFCSSNRQTWAWRGNSKFAKVSFESKLTKTSSLRVDVLFVCRKWVREPTKTRNWDKVSLVIYRFLILM